MILVGTHIVGGWSDSSTNGWKVDFGGGGGMTACPNFVFWGIYGIYKQEENKKQVFPL